MYRAFNNDISTAYWELKEVAAEELKKSGFVDTLQLLLQSGLFQVVIREDDRQWTEENGWDNGHFSHVSFEPHYFFDDIENEGSFILELEPNHSGLCGDPKWLKNLNESVERLKKTNTKFKRKRKKTARKKKTTKKKTVRKKKK